MPASNNAALTEARSLANKQLKRLKSTQEKLQSTEDVTPQVRFVRSDALKQMQSLEAKVPKEFRSPVRSIILTLEKWERENVEKLSANKKIRSRQAAFLQSLQTETQKVQRKLLESISESEKKSVAAVTHRHCDSSNDILFSGLMWSPFCSAND